MADFSIRIPVNSFRTQFLEINSINKIMLSGLVDTMYKPLGADLRKYHPGRTCLRLRETFGQESTLVELKTIKTGMGYTDEKTVFGEGQTEELKKKAKEMGFEPWGTMTVTSTEYTLKIGKNLVTALLQEIKPIGKFIKIESSSSETLTKCLRALKVSSDEKLEKNAAVLLAEKMNLV